MPEVIEIRNCVLRILQAQRQFELSRPSEIGPGRPAKPVLGGKLQTTRSTSPSELRGQLRDENWHERRYEELRDALAEFGATVLDATLAAPQPLETPDIVRAIAEAAQFLGLPTAIPQATTSGTGPHAAAVPREFEAGQTDDPPVGSIIKLSPAVMGVAAGDAQTRIGSADLSHIESAAVGRSSREPGDDVDLTPDLAAGLQAKLRANQTWERQTRPSAVGDAKLVSVVLRSTFDVLGPTPDSLDDEFAVEREVGRLLEVAGAHRLKEWSRAGCVANRTIGNLVAARARAAQEAAETFKRRDLLDRLAALFPTLSQHSKQTQPGTIFGLARAHTAGVSGGWLERARTAELQLKELDANPSADDEDESGDEEDKAHTAELLRQLCEQYKNDLSSEEFSRRAIELIEAGFSAQDHRLVNMALAYADTLEDERLRGLRKAVRRVADPEDEGDNSGKSLLPEDWSCFEFTRGKRAVLIGGEPRKERIQTLCDAFGFESLDWMSRPNTGLRQVDPLLERMRNGNVDLVIGLRAFSSHSVTNKIFQARVPGCLVVLADSYGMNQLRLAIERYSGNGSN